MSFYFAIMMTLYLICKKRQHKNLERVSCQALKNTLLQSGDAFVKNPMIDYPEIKRISKTSYSILKTTILI